MHVHCGQAIKQVRVLFKQNLVYAQRFGISNCSTSRNWCASFCSSRNSCLHNAFESQIVGLVIIDVRVLFKQKLLFAQCFGIRDCWTRHNWCGSSVQAEPLLCTTLSNPKLLSPSYLMCKFCSSRNSCSHNVVESQIAERVIIDVRVLFTQKLFYALRFRIPNCWARHDWCASSVQAEPLLCTTFWDPRLLSSSKLICLVWQTTSC